MYWWQPPTRHPRAVCAGRMRRLGTGSARASRGSSVSTGPLRRSGMNRLVASRVDLVRVLGGELVCSAYATRVVRGEARRRLIAARGWDS